MNRLYNLDYLRGLAAFGIMVFHYLSWTLGKFSADSFLGRVGVYGVSIFYVLSGLTLFYVYYDKMAPSPKGSSRTKKDVLDFAKKRFFRIFPLLWLATIVSILISAKMPAPFNLFLNLTGLFGFYNWNAAYAFGAWSIGNELVFYLFFPFFVLFIKRSLPAMIILSMAIFAVYLIFAFFIMDNDISLLDQWKNYTNPLNQVFLFLGGFLIGYFFQTVEIKRSVNLLILVVGLATFIFFPVHGNVSHLVTEWYRLLFTLSCFLICFSFYKLTIKLPFIFHKPLSLLGEASYSVYLLHPIVYTIVGYLLMGPLGGHFPESVRLICSVLGTLLISHLVYTYYEKFFMRLGKSKRKEI